MTAQPNTASIVSVSVSADERALLESAAAQSHTNLSDFVRRKALEAAEIDVLGRTIFTIPASDWKKFEAWLDRPAESIPGLQALGRLTPSWDR